MARSERYFTSREPGTRGTHSREASREFLFLVRGNTYSRENRSPFLLVLMDFSVDPRWRSDGLDGSARRRRQHPHGGGLHPHGGGDILAMAATSSWRRLHYARRRLQTTSRGGGCILGAENTSPHLWLNRPVSGYIPCVSGYIARKVMDLLAASFSI